MAIARVDLSDLQQTIPIVDSGGLPTPAFLRYLNTVIRSLKSGVNSLIDVQNAVDAANAAAAAAAAAAATANTAAATANTAASTAQTTADTVAQDTSLANSWITPTSVLSATPTTITIAPHTRTYGDGTSVAVSGGTVSTTGGAAAIDYVSYSDPARSGGTVTYVASTTAPTQVGTTHVVGAVKVPASGTAAGGEGPRPPGYVSSI